MKPLIYNFFKQRRGRRYCAFEVARLLSYDASYVETIMDEFVSDGFLIKLNGGRAHPETRKYNAFYQTA